MRVVAIVLGLCLAGVVPAAAQVTAGGNGGGLIARNPAGIDCPGASCSITVDAGTLIELMASADATSRLSGWSGVCAGAGAGACAITVSSDTTVEATFVRQIDVEVKIIGSGNVSSTPAGIACVGDCSERFDTGADVVLTANAAAGWRFTGWSGDPACTGLGSCTLWSPDYRVASVTATFVEQFTLDVVLAGNGSGTVASAPDISCPGDCSATYDPNTMVTLMATADAASLFAGWSGACSGSGACVVTMTAAPAVRATFEAGVSIASVSSDIAALAPVIGSGPVSSVTGKLTNAQASVARGNVRAAANQLNAAINEIEALVRSRRLDEATGAALVADLQAIIGSF